MFSGRASSPVAEVDGVAHVGPTEQKLRRQDCSYSRFKTYATIRLFSEFFLGGSVVGSSGPALTGADVSVVATTFCQKK